MSAAPGAVRPAKEDDPPSCEELRSYQRDGRAWVRTDRDDRPWGCLLSDVVDGCAHLEQVTVHPEASRLGLGRELIEHLTAWARERDLPAITLTTYTDVPWNGPYHERPEAGTAGHVAR